MLWREFLKGQCLHSCVVLLPVDVDGQFCAWFAEVTEREPEGDHLFQLR